MRTPDLFSPVHNCVQLITEPQDVRHAQNLVNWLLHQNRARIENEVHIIDLSSRNIVDRKELFDLFADRFAFPEYFGFNLDALYDCLCDLSWHDPRIGHFLFLGLPPSSNFRHFDPIISLLSDVSLYHARTNRLFKIFILTGPVVNAYPAL